MDRFPGPQKSRDKVCPIVARVAGDDAVVIGRETLRLGKRLMSAGRAAVEIGIMRQASIVIADD